MANTSEAHRPDATNWTDATKAGLVCPRCGTSKSEHIPLNFNEGQPRYLCPTALWQEPIPTDVGGAAT